jgi:NADH dehydrogenase FAD-containing subunit
MTTKGLQHLVLVGTGLAHLQVLKSFAERRSAGLKITVIGNTIRPVYFDRVPDFVTGACTAQACAVPLESLLQSCDAVFIEAAVEALEASTHTLTLSNGETIRYGVLSVDTAPSTPRTLLDTQWPGATQHALSLYPLEMFCKLWPQLSALAKTRALNVVVVAGHLRQSTDSDVNNVTNAEKDATHTLPAVALALALAHSLTSDPANQPSRVTLVTGGGEPAALCPPAVQRHLMTALKQAHITVLRERCASISATELTLASGARLVCDAPVLALDAAPPLFWGKSGLPLDLHGYPAINFNFQSTQQAGIFAIPSGNDELRTASAGNAYVRSGPLL